MANTTQTAVEAPDHEYLNAPSGGEYLNVTTKKPAVVSTTAPKDTSTSVSPLSIIGGSAAFILGSIISIIKLYIGRRYANDCPANWHIPHYLVVAGAVGIVVAILSAISIAMQYKTAADAARGTPKAAPFGVICCVGSLSGILNIFLFIWFIFGCIWVFGSRNDMQHVDPSQGDYCHPVLYRFAFWLLIIALILPILSCCLGCWKTSHSVQQIKGARAAATTTEP